jgi:hypothetical protein
MKDDKAAPGRKMKIPATTWNTMLECVADFQLRRQMGQPGQTGSVVPSSSIVKIKNSSGSAVRAGDVLDVSGFLLTEVRQNYLWFDGDTPDASTRGWGVVRRQLPADAIGEMQVAGACIAYVNVTDEDHGYATRSSGNVVLQSASTGSVKILHKPTGTGEKLCAVLLTAEVVAPVADCIATLDGAMDPGDSMATVDGVVSLGGGSAPSVGSPSNTFGLAGQDGDTVLLKYNASSSSWFVAQVKHQLHTVVVKHTGDGVFIKRDTGAEQLNGYVLAMSSVVSSGTPAYEIQLNTYTCP